jgi:DNA-binding HxlR family transcriptional regulator
MAPPETPLPGRPVRGSDTGRPIMALLDLLGRRWALRVLWELWSGPVPELREAGIVERADDGYRLSARGGELGQIILKLAGWAADWKPPA